MEKENEVKELVKNEILPEIVNEIAQERELLTKTVQGIEDFVKGYSALKKLLEDFSLSENLNLTESFNEISKSIANIEETVQSYNQSLSPSYEKLATDLNLLIKQYKSILESQQNLNTFLSKIEKFMEAIEESNFSNLIEMLNNNLEKVEVIKQNVEENNKKIETLSNTISQFSDADAKQRKSLIEIAAQTQQTNVLLAEMMKKDNINIALLFSLMDEWWENKKKNKRN